MLNAVDVAWSTGVSTVLVSVVSVLYNWWRKLEDDKRLAQYKSELDKDATAYKAEFDKEVATRKAVLDQELEGIKKQHLSDVERLKSELTGRAESVKYVREKQISAREGLILALDEFIGLPGLERYSLYRDMDDVDIEDEAHKLGNVAFQLVDWYTRNGIFIPKLHRDNLSPLIKTLKNQASMIISTHVREGHAEMNDVERLGATLNSVSVAAFAGLDAALESTIIEIVEANS